MYDKIMHEVEINHKRTDGKCGLDPVSLCEKLGITFEEVKVNLNQLYFDGKISIRKGKNGKLIFKK